MKSNKLLLFLAVGLLALLLIACSGEGNETSGDADETQTMGDGGEDATELTFWTFATQHNAFYEKAVDRWNEENPDRPITLNAETYPFDQMHNNLLLALQSSEGAPDIVDIEISRFPNYLEGEPQILPMNEYVEPVMEDFVEARFDIYSKDGQYYGMPTHVGANMMYYNTEIMEEAGVDIDSIKTWDDYVEAGHKVVENTDAMMTSFPTGDFIQYWALMSQQGSDFVSEDGELTINNQTNTETLQFQQDLIYEEEIAEVMPGGEPHAEEYYAYMNDGKSASLTMPMWYMGRFLDNMPDLSGKMAIRPMPQWEEGGNRSAGMGGTGTVVTNQTEHPDLAKEFLAFAKLSEQGNIDLWTVLGFDPPMWTVWESPALQEDNEYFQYFSEDIFDTLLSVREEINGLNITQQTPAISEQMGTNVLDSVLRQQSQTPEEALDAAQEAVENQ
ncbi:ABC transporter substrate-binding protein [Thalassobacillus sp. CUG 92003]|uniref:ABC transporter substrate-binding protein n=1 Tax=Thalassobacillus sp. CUG 92003 TaxID=2736641 RepID=UPI0015E635B9|nr:sugar ABC transporter substrate-binding protein [Thalassobacillus sp. CUG 92003]